MMATWHMGLSRRGGAARAQGALFGCIFSGAVQLGCDGSDGEGPSGTLPGAAGARGNEDASSGGGPPGVEAAPGPGQADAVVFDGVLTLTRGGVDEGTTMANIDLESQELAEPRQLLGVNGNRNARGEFAFTSPCGIDGTGYAVYIADPAGTPTDTVVECADHNESIIDAEFSAIRLSPDGSKVSVQPTFASFSPLSTFVYTRTGEELARFENYVAANWTVDGRLMLVGDGLWLTDAELANLSRVDGGQIIARMGTPTPHPDGQRVAFQYTGGIYQINLDGSGFGKLYENEEVAYSPVWSPDGQALAFLLSDGIGPERAIYFFDTRMNRTYALSTEVLFGEDYVSRFPFGPLSWNPS